MFDLPFNFPPSISQYQPGKRVKSLVLQRVRKAIGRSNKHVPALSDSETRRSSHHQLQRLVRGITRSPSPISSDTDHPSHKTHTHRDTDKATTSHNNHTR